MYEILITFLIISIILCLIYIKKKNKYNKTLFYKNYNKNSNLIYEVFMIEELKRLYNELQEKDKKIHFLTYNDSLTKLPNKTCFIENSSELLSKEPTNEKFALFFINIDNFANINTVHGHNYGDKVLLLISEILKIILPKESVLYRWYGDEFLVMIRNLEDNNMAAKIAENIINSFTKPLEISEKQIYITISIGISMYPNENLSINDIAKSAELAMHKSKDKGKNKYTFYNDEIHKNIYRKNNICRHLGNAIYNNELYLNYQPQFDIATGKIIGYEALLRWNSRELGQVSPMEFIPIAEENGLIIALGNWVLRNACKQNRRWITRGFCNVIAVNISAVQFEQDNFVHVVEDILRETKLLPQFLELEITENVLIKSLEKSIKTIEKLNQLGLKVSLDDFGTGYSSLSYLKRLPIDNLKIDKSFIDDIAVSKDSKSILHAIVQLAHTIHLKVIAEGIETIEQNEMLKKVKCDVGQGYYYSKPVSSEEIESILNINLERKISNI